MPDPDESLANRRAFLDALMKLDSRPRSGKLARMSESRTESLARPKESPLRPEPVAARNAEARPHPQARPEKATLPEPPSQEAIIAEIGESVRAEAGRIFRVAIPSASPAVSPPASALATPEPPTPEPPREMPRLDQEKPEAPKKAARREPPRVVAGKTVTRLAEVYVKAPQGGDSRSFQDMVREALSQELRGWLDQNLERVVEDILREEIGRMGREAKDRVAGFTQDKEERTGS